MISVNSVTGDIFVSSSKPVGTYIIKVVGTLPNLVTTTSEIFTITIKANNVPVFSSPLPNVIVPLFSSTNYKFPLIIDADIGSTTSIKTVMD